MVINLFFTSQFIFLIMALFGQCFSCIVISVVVEFAHALYFIRSLRLPALLAPVLAEV
jgi:hypothetical protein